MKALLLVAHGSRRQASNEEVKQVAELLAQEIHGGFDHVDFAFLELAEPDIPQGIRQCVERGAEEIVVVPYFLSAGRHVAQDIPDEIAKAQAEFPSVKIYLTEHLGAAQGISKLLADLGSSV